MRFVALALIATTTLACGVTEAGDAGLASDAGLDAGTPVGDAGPADGDAGLDAGTPGADAGFDAGTGPADAGAFASTCPTTGLGPIDPAGPCTFFTPAQAGATASGVNADAGSYALEPPSGALGKLVVYLPASLSTPERQVPDPTVNFYNTAARAGYHLLALSYRNDSVLGISCKLATPAASNACFEGTRKTIITGLAAPGAPGSLATSILPDEGIVARLDAALRYLVQARPGAGWEQFFADPNAGTAEARIAWPKLVAAGHSQGGGHAAFLAQLYPISRVVQLSSTCDLVDGQPADWTASTRTWATAPSTRFEGLGNPSDSICPGHVAIWQNLGLAIANQHDDAVNCKSASYAHECTVFCTANAERWAQLLQ